MIEIEFRKECTRCGAVINREFFTMADRYTGKRIIVTKDICQQCRNKNHYKPDYDEEAAALYQEDIQRINNLIGQRSKIR